MQLSTRNRIPGVIESIKTGDIMAGGAVRIGEFNPVSVITRGPAETLSRWYL